MQTLSDTSEQNSTSVLGLGCPGHPAEYL